MLSSSDIPERKLTLPPRGTDVFAPQIMGGVFLTLCIVGPDGAELKTPFDDYITIPTGFFVEKNGLWLIDIPDVDKNFLTTLEQQIIDRATYCLGETRYDITSLGIA